jgi:integrase/recombinase XerD
MSTINLSPSKPSLDARQLEQLLDLYLEDVALRKRPATVRDYAYALSVFRAWWQINGPVRGWLMERNDLQRFGRDLETMYSHQHKRPLSYHTRKTILGRLKQALRWAVENEYTERDYGVWVPDVEGEPTERHTLPVDQLAQLMAAVETGRYQVRDRAILAVLIGTGMRRSECAGLRVEDVNLYADGAGEIAIRRGKGGKARIVLFGEATGLCLDAYLGRRVAGWLWLSHRHQRLTGKGLYQVVKRVVARAGLERYIAGPHDLRRLFATTWNRNRKGLSVAAPLSKQLGHTSPAMTLRYILPEMEDIRREYISPMELVEWAV